MPQQFSLPDKDSVLTWLTATAFSLFFGEIVGPVLAHHPLPLLMFPVPFLIYYAILSGVFTVVVTRSARLALAFMFLYGVSAELLLFHTIQGISDIPGILFFGLFYVFLFGMPVFIVKIARMVDRRKTL